LRWQTSFSVTSEIRRRDLRRALTEVERTLEDWILIGVVTLGNVCETKMGPRVDLYLREDLPLTSRIILRELTAAELITLILPIFVDSLEMHTYRRLHSNIILDMDRA
jgi:hypothetical protein